MDFLPQKINDRNIINDLQWIFLPQKTVIIVKNRIGGSPEIVESLSLFTVYTIRMKTFPVFMLFCNMVDVIIPE